MMAKQEQQQPPGTSAEMSTQTSGVPSEEDVKRQQAAAEALKIVAKPPPEPDIKEYMRSKQEKFHEKGMDDEWAVIAKAVGADKPTTEAQPIHNP
jgi:hypothetical protein